MIRQIQLAEFGVKLANRGLTGNPAVIEVAGDHHHVDLFLLSNFLNLLKDGLLVSQQVKAVQVFTDVPIGGMQKTHYAFFPSQTITLFPIIIYTQYFPNHNKKAGTDKMSIPA